MKQIVERGLFWLEYLAYWKGQVTVGQVAKKLGVTRETVQREIMPESKYLMLERKPGVGIRPRGDIEDIKVCPYRPSENLRIISAEKVFEAHMENYQPVDIQFEDLSWDTMNGQDEEKFRILQTGIIMKHCFHVHYVAKSGQQTFDFSPHAIVKSCFRVHFRGFAQYPGKPGIYIDLIPGRLIGLEYLGGENYISSARDKDWNEKVLLKADIMDDRDITERNALVQEYGDLPVTVHTRRANIIYIKEELELRYKALVPGDQTGWHFTEESEKSN